MQKKSMLILFFMTMSFQSAFCSETSPKKTKPLSKRLYKTYKENKTIIGLLSSAALFTALAYATTKSTQPDRNKILLANAALGGSCGALAGKLDVLEGWTMGAGIMATSIACNSELNKGETSLSNAAWTIAHGTLGAGAGALHATSGFALGSAAMGIAARAISHTCVDPLYLIQGGVIGGLNSISANEEAPMEIRLDAARTANFNGLSLVFQLSLASQSTSLRRAHETINLQGQTIGIGIANQQLLHQRISNLERQLYRQ